MTEVDKRCSLCGTLGCYPGLHDADSPFGDRSPVGHFMDSKDKMCSKGHEQKWELLDWDGGTPFYGWWCEGCVSELKDK